jgi:hypothetical protein
MGAVEPFGAVLNFSLCSVAGGCSVSEESRNVTLGWFTIDDDPLLKARVVGVGMLSRKRRQ